MYELSSIEREYYKRNSEEVQLVLMKKKHLVKMAAAEVADEQI